MKLIALSSLLLVATSQAFVVPSSSIATKSTLNAVGMPMGASASTVTPIIEDKKAPLTGIRKKYRAQDGSVILGHDFRLTMEIALMAPLIYYQYGPQDGTAGAVFHVALALWIGWQANRVRAVFDKNAIEFYNLKGMGAAYKSKPAKCDNRLMRKPDNWLVNGSPNRWNYETITGYYFYPSIEFPVVTILWETETGNKYSKDYGEQPHFFPCLFNAKQFKEEMDKHNVPYKLPFV